METTVKLVLNEDGAFLVFKDEDEVHQYIKYIELHDYFLSCLSADAGIKYGQPL